MRFWVAVSGLTLLAFAINWGRITYYAQCLEIEERNRRKIDPAMIRCAALNAAG